MGSELIFNNHIISIIRSDSVDAFLNRGGHVMFVETEITDQMIKNAEQCLLDNGIDADEVYTVLQAIGYILLDTELYPGT